MLASLDSNMTDAISESGPAYPSGAPGFISGLSWSTCSSLVTSDRSFSHDDIVLSIKKVHHKEDSIFMCSYASVGTASTRGLYIYVFLCVNCNIYVFICVSWYSIYERTLYLCFHMRQLVQHLREDSICMCSYASVGTIGTSSTIHFSFETSYLTH